MRKDDRQGEPASASTSKLNKIVIAVLLMPIALVVLMLSLQWVEDYRLQNPAPPSKLEESVDIRGTEEGRLVEEYLLLKYGEEFELGETYIYQNKTVDAQDILTKIHPTSNLQMTATINTTHTPDLSSFEDKVAYNNGTFYGDSYIDALWDWQYNNDIAPLMKDLFGEDVIFEADLYWSPVDYPMYPWYGRTVSYDEAWGLGERQLLHFRAMVFTNDGEMLQKKVEQVLAHFCTQIEGLSNTYITIGFYKKPERNEILEQMDLSGKSFMDYVMDDVSIKTGMMVLPDRKVYQQVAVTLNQKEQLLLKLQDMPIVK